MMNPKLRVYFHKQRCTWLGMISSAMNSALYFAATLRRNCAHHFAIRPSNTWRLYLGQPDDGVLARIDDVVVRFVAGDHGYAVLQAPNECRKVHLTSHV